MATNTPARADHCCRNSAADEGYRAARLAGHCGAPRSSMPQPGELLSSTVHVLLALASAELPPSAASAASAAAAAATAASAFADGAAAEQADGAPPPFAEGGEQPWEQQPDQLPPHAWRPVDLAPPLQLALWDVGNATAGPGGAAARSKCPLGGAIAGHHGLLRYSSDYV